MEQFEFLKNKNILIIGPPGSGKTFLSNKIGLSHKVIHTDDYLNDPYPIDSIMQQVWNNKLVLIEGCLGYNLLRKGYAPDVVIEIEVDDSQVSNIENTRGKNYSSFNKANQTILADYFARRTSNPEWIKIRNKYAGNF